MIAFADVSPSAAFYDALQNAFRMGLMDWIDGRNFEPKSEVTVAQAIAMTAEMHRITTNGSSDLKDGFWLWWYKPYRKYALEHNLIDKEYAGYSRRDLNRAVTHGELVEMFINILPDSGYEAINDIPDNAIPDVKDFTTNADIIYTLYRAGILTGYVDTPGVTDHTFKSHDHLSRMDAAVIADRIMNEDNRVEFTIQN